MTRPPVVVAALLVLAGVAPVAAPVSATQSQAYAGSHVAFDTESNAVVGYQVDDSTVVQEVTVQSASQAGIGGDLEGTVGLEGSGLSVSATSETTATVESESGARLTAHDNTNGVLVVSSASGEQVVHADVSGSAEAAGEDRVVVENDDGTEGAFIVVGEGDVAVDQRGNVTATVSGDGKLVYRQYDGSRSESTRTQEELIANGTATAEVYYQEAGDEGGERTADVVEYGSDTSVEVTSRTESELNMTVERSASQGKVVLTHVSEAAMSGSGSSQVYVDGEAAAEANSYAEVVSATEGGDRSAFLVRNSATAEATTQVVVGVNHFSARSVSVQGGDGGGSTGTFGPGFGAIAAVVAVGLALLAGRRFRR